MAKFDPKNPPIFFDATGRRWLFTKVIFGLILVNTILFSLLVGNYLYKRDDQSTLAQAVNNATSLVNLPTLQVKARTLTETIKDETNKIDKQGNYYATISPKDIGNYTYIRDKVQYLDKIVCDCYDINSDDQKVVITDNSTSEKNVDIRQTINYIETYRPSVTIAKKITLTNDLINNIDQLLIAVGKLPNSTEEVIVDIDRNNLVLTPDLISSLNKLNTKNKISILTGSNQSPENLVQLAKISSQLYIKPISFNIEQNEFDQTYRLENIQTLSRLFPAVKIALHLPTYSSFGQSMTQVNNLITQNTDSQIQVNNSGVPFISSPQGQKNYLANQIYYHNLQNQLKELGLSNFINATGFDSLVDIAPDSLTFLSTVDRESSLNIFENGFRTTDKTIRPLNDNGAILTLKTSSKAGILKLEQKLGAITSAKIITKPTENEVNQQGDSKVQVALSFDDGPDPEWTPKVLDVLKANNIKASFFVMGKNVEAYPELAVRIVKEGHLIGNHTYNHINVNDATNAEIESQITKTNQIIERVTGVKPFYFRTPYNANSGKFNENDIRTLKIINNLGMRIAESDTDGKDYTGITAEQIVQSATTDIKSQILLHDAGDKQNTVEALPNIIRIAQSKKRIFVTLEEIDKLNNDTQVDPEKYLATKTDLPLPVYRYLKSGNWDISTYIRLILDYIGVLIVIALYITFGASILRLIILIIGNILYRPFKQGSKKIIDYPISILVPAYNEGLVIVNTIHSLLNSTYQNFEILIIDDGSKDDTLQILEANFGNHPKVRILPKANGGKASALNYGITRAKYDYFLSMDADTIFSPDAIELMMRHFSDPAVKGVAGNVVVGNDIGSMKVNNPKLNIFKHFNILPIFQRIEYIVSNNFAKRGFAPFNCTYIVPGAIGAYHKSTVMALGNYETDTLGEDMEVSIKLLKDGHKVSFEPNAYSITEAPEKLGELYKQRKRWSYGGLQVLFKHSNMLLNPKYGLLSLFALPYLLLILITSVFGPIFIINTLVFAVKFGLELFKIGTVSNFDKQLFFYSIAIFGITTLSETITYIYSAYLDRGKGASKYLIAIFIPFLILFYNVIIAMVSMTSIFRSLKGEAHGWGHLTRTGNVQQVVKTKITH